MTSKHFRVDTFVRLFFREDLSNQDTVLYESHQKSAHLVSGALTN